MLSHPFRRKINPPTVPTQLDDLLDHLFTVEFELGFVLNEIQLVCPSRHVRQWSFLRRHGVYYVIRSHRDNKQTYHDNVAIKERGRIVKRNDTLKNGPEESLLTPNFSWSEFYVIVQL
jgi:hypothetical protein